MMHTAVHRFNSWRICATILLFLFSGCHGAHIVRRLAGQDDDYTSPRRVNRLPDVTLRDARPIDEALAGKASSSNNPVQRVQFLVPVDEASPSNADQAAAEPPQPDALRQPLPPAPREAVGQEPYPIDLSTALALAGANNLQIALAAQRVQQAAGRMDQADVLWLPSLNAGIVYNNHAGRLQETEGTVLEISRNSLFVGAAAVTGFSATAGGSSGPARLVVDLPLVDVLFEPLAARQLVRATEADQGTTFNDTLLEVTVAYLNLLEAQFQVAIAQEAVTNAEELAKLTEDFARAGEGLRADAQRAQAELSDRRTDLLRAKESVAVASAELVRLVRLDPAVTLVPTDSQVGPIDVVDAGTALPDLIRQAMAARPENVRQDALIEETWLRLRQEELRPWMPHLYVGFSGGGFGGAQGGDVKNFSDRTDFDAAAVWELQNIGFGNAARQRQQESIHLQAHIAADQIRDIVASEVSRAYHQVQLRRQQIDVARREVQAASEALFLNFDGIRGKVLRPIEAQQAIGALAAARRQYLAAVIDYNRAQFGLLRAIGMPPGARPQDTAAS